MKSLTRFALISLLLLTGVGIHTVLGAEKNPVAHIEDFKFYYSSGNDEIVEKMKQKDMVVVEPVMMERSYMEEAQEAGTVLYGYISAMEVAAWNQDLVGKLQEKAYFHDQAGDRIHIPKWDSYLMDITSDHYQSVLLEEIENRIVNNGLDGVFLDTVGDIEVYHRDQPEVMKEQQEGMKKLVQRINQRYPDLSIAQNWGFDTLENYTGEYVDFFLWEDFSASNIESDSWYKNKIDQLNRVQTEHNVEVLALSYEDQAASQEIAEENGFKINHHPEGTYYNQW